MTLVQPLSEKPCIYTTDPLRAGGVGDEGIIKTVLALKKVTDLELKKQKNTQKKNNNQVFSPTPKQEFLKLCRPLSDEKKGLRSRRVGWVGDEGIVARWSSSVSFETRS